MFAILGLLGPLSAGAAEKTVEVLARIEIPMGSTHKYEIDAATGQVHLDRIMSMPVAYPGNYGSLEGTLADDGDALDAVVLTREPIHPGTFVRVRPIGYLRMIDGGEGDDKLICVPIDTTFPYYSDVAETKDLPSIIFQQIEHFFTHYKDLEAEKWVRIGQWGDAADAKRVVAEAIERAKAAH